MDHNHNLALSRSPEQRPEPVEALIEGPVEGARPEPAEGETNVLPATSSIPGWVLWLACLLPIAGLVAVTVFNISVSTVVLLALVLACPLSHFLMMRHGGHGHAGAPADSVTTTEEAPHLLETSIQE